ncbi:MAG: MOSC domain-containing protein [Candidatus Limnocylindrales bacterium]
MQETQGRQFDAHLDDIRAAVADDGPLELIVRRPAEGEREVLDEARLEIDGGLIGDRWAARHAPTTPASRATQLTVMSTRVLAAIEPDRSRWPLAGDQLYVDLDLSVDNLPAGSRLAIGSAIVEVSEMPHTGCAKFSARFGGDALAWINSPIGRVQRMRGLNARIVVSGAVRVGDRVRKV